jgi:hypothetical protein
LGKKLDPVTVTLVPMGPLDGLSVSEEAITVKLAETASGTVSPADTVWLPEIVMGTLNVHENAPVALLITVEGNVVRGNKSKFIAIACVGSKFEPVIVTLAPLDPLVGFKVMVRVTTLKVLMYEFVPSVAITFFVPAEEEGTINEPENEPELSVCNCDGEVRRLTPLKLNVMLAEAAKPCPVIETEVPYGPVAGLRIVFGITVNVEVATLLVESVQVTT